MDAGDLRIRNLTYELFVEFGRAPTGEEASVAAGGNVRESWRRLHALLALLVTGARVDEQRRLLPRRITPRAGRAA